MNQVPTPGQSFANYLDAYVRAGKKPKVVVVGIYSEVADKFHKDAIYHLEAMRKAQEESSDDFTHVEFHSFNTDKDGYMKIATDVLVPPINCQPTYICFLDGVEANDGNGGLKRLEVREKPNSPSELSQKISAWLEALGF